MSDVSILPSRNEARAALESALAHENGPILLTGDAGVGKTWLHRRIRAALSTSYRWLEIDLTPSVDPLEFQRLILQGFGYDTSASLAQTRGLLSDLLVDASSDAYRWVLVIEEAHDASDAILEEIRVLGNRLGESDGFAGILLVGQNSLIRRLSTRHNNSLASRLAGRIHLRPFTIDEFSDWVTELEPSRIFSEADFEQLHRSLGGNPRRYLVETQQARKPRTAIDRSDATSMVEMDEPEPLEAEPLRTPPLARSWDVPSVIPQKPPLEVAEEMIEVGWDATSELSLNPEGEREDGSDEDARASEPRSLGSSAGQGSEEVIDDHYAALQAWTEWAHCQGREPVAPRGRLEKIEIAEHDPELTDPLPDDESPWTPPQAGTSGNRVETEHAFAPYSQLFSRLRESQSRESAG